MDPTSTGRNTNGNGDSSRSSPRLHRGASCHPIRKRPRTATRRLGSDRLTGMPSPDGEYWAARDGAGLVVLSGRGVLEATGPARQTFLQGMLSNEVAGLTPGRGRRAALLSPKGAVQAFVRVLALPDRVLLETEDDRLAGLQRTLERHRVAAPVRFAVVATSVLAVLGPRADEVVAAAGLPLPPQEGESHVEGDLAGRVVRLVRAGDLPRGGIVLQLPPDLAQLARERLIAAGAPAIGDEALDALRIEALRPWYGADVTEANLLHETGLLTELHSPTKGCYVGQEIVARLTARGGNVNKALRGLMLAAPAVAGSAIAAEGQAIGRLTTAAVSPRLGPIAMGYVRRSHFAHRSAVEVDGRRATVVTGFEG